MLINGIGRNLKHSFKITIPLIFFIISISQTRAEGLGTDAPIETSSLSSDEITKKLQIAELSWPSNPKLFKESILELKKQDNITEEQRHHLNLLFAGYYMYSGKHQETEIKLKELLSSNANSLIKFRAKYGLIVFATVTKNWGDGLKYLAITHEQLPAINDNKHIQNALLAIITFYSQMGQHELALSNAKELAQQELLAKNSCGLKQLTLRSQFFLGKLQLDEFPFAQAIEECINADFLIVANLLRLLKAKFYLQEGMPEQALELLLKYAPEARATHYPMLVAGISNSIAKAYWQLNDIKNTKEFATEALKYNPNVSNLLQGVDTYHLLYQIAKAENNPTLALEYYEKYAEIERANLEGEKAKHLAFQLAQHQAFEQESQIALLNEKNALLETKQALSEAEVTNTRLIIMVLIISLLLFTFWGGRLYKAHKRIKELAEFDALTGIFNRGHFTQVATSALNYCESAKQDLSVIIFDLDHFKSVNDTYGHATGDWALIEAISVCKDFGRQNDIFARLGGEEFCILLPSCDIRTAALRAEQCRQAIEEIVTEASGHDFKLTASFGVTDAKTSGFELEKLLADADSAAYESKHAGRNRITVFTVEEEPEQKQLDSSWSIT